MRLADLAINAFFADVSKFQQKNILSGLAANVTTDDAICFDFGMWVAGRISSKDILWTLPVVNRQKLDDNFALTLAVQSGEKEGPSMQELANIGLERRQSSFDSKSNSETEKLNKKGREESHNREQGQPVNHHLDRHDQGLPRRRLK